MIARGGMGEVLRAYDSRHDRWVALKVLSPHLAADEEYRERFRSEAHAAARLREPHVVPIHAYGEIDGQLYLDMRLIEGDDVATRLSASGPMDPAEAVGIVVQVAHALAAAHAEGLVHRDVKPSNVIVDGTGFAYLVDFGISRSIDTSKGLTSTGNAIGTLDYMAPERFAGDRMDHRVDIYSLACLLYQCLTGAKPFGDLTPASLVNAHLHQAPPRPSRLRMNMTPEFDAVVARGMAKDPADRYSTAPELAQAAEAALRGRKPVAAAVPPRTYAFTTVEPTRRTPSNPQWFVGLVAVLLAVGVVLLLALPRTSSNTDARVGVLIPVITSPSTWVAPPAQLPSVSSPSTASPASSSDLAPNPDDVADFVIGYYRLMPDTTAGWSRIGPSLRQRTKESYDKFWSKFSSAEVVGRPTITGWTVTAQIAFRYRDGKSPVTETHVLGIVRCGDSLCIDTDTVTKSR